MGGGGCGDDDTEEKDVKNLASGVLVTDSFRFFPFRPFPFPAASASSSFALYRARDRFVSSGTSLKLSVSRVRNRRTRPTSEQSRAGSRSS